MGRMQDHMIVRGMDFSCFSMGAVHAAFPVSSRSLRAFWRSMTGIYVSGTNRMISPTWTALQMMRT
jgi:hypothetical protein